MAPEITHIIYDNDGLLLDTEPFYTKAHQIMAARYGKIFDWTVKSKMIGLRAEDSAKVLISFTSAAYVGTGIPRSPQASSGRTVSSSGTFAGSGPADNASAPGGHTSGGGYQFGPL